MKNPEQIKAFASHLRRLREKANFSQDELANSSGIAKKTIQRIEKAESNVTLDTMFSLADGLGISLKKLVDY